MAEGVILTLTDSSRIVLQLQKSLDQKGICPHNSTIKFFEYKESESSGLGKMNRMRSPNLREEQHRALVSDFSHTKDFRKNPLSLQLFNSMAFTTHQVFGLISPFEIQHQSSERLENVSVCVLLNTLERHLWHAEIQLHFITIQADSDQTLHNGSLETHTEGP